MNNCMHTACQPSSINVCICFNHITRIDHFTRNGNSHSYRISLRCQLRLQVFILFGKDVVSVDTSRLVRLETVSRRTNFSSRVSGHYVSSRRFMQARAVHTVAAVRAILTSMTFVA